MSGSPVVLNISSGRDVVPVAGILKRVFLIFLGIAEEEVGVVVSAVEFTRIASCGGCELPVKSKTALRGGEVILNFFVEGPTGAELELMRALRPGNVIANLIIVSGVVPRLPSYGVVSPSCSTQMNFRNPITGIFAGKDSIKGKI